MWNYVQEITAVGNANTFYTTYAGDPLYTPGVSVEGLVSTVNQPDFYAHTYINTDFAEPDWRNHDCEALVYDLNIADGNELTGTAIGLLLIGAQAQAYLTDWVLNNNVFSLTDDALAAVKMLRPNWIGIAAFSIGVVATLDGLHWDAEGDRIRQRIQELGCEEA